MRELLARFGGIAGLLRRADLLEIKGLGPAKRAQFAAAIELARRSIEEELKGQNALTSPGAVRDYLRAGAWAAGQHEVFVCIWLDAQHRVIEMRGSLPGHPHADQRLPAGDRQERPWRGTPPR